MANYERMAATAKRLIEKNGRTVSLHRLSRSPEAAAKPWRGPDPAPGEQPDPVSCKAVIVPYSEKEMDGSLIRLGDKRAFVAEGSVDSELVETYDILRDGSVDYRVLTVNTINPGDTRILYELHLRR